MGLAAMFCFWRWLKRLEWLETFLAGLVLGLAELCKFTLLIFYPLVPLLWLIFRLPERKTMSNRDWRRQALMLAVILLLSVYMINCGYLFEGTFTLLEDFRFRSLLFTGCDFLADVPPEGANRFAGRWLGKLPVPLPANMLQGIDTQRYDFERGLPSYLRGEWAEHGWWYYYLYALLLKMPLGVWLLMLFAFLATVCRRSYSAPWRDEMAVLAPGLTILIFVSSQTGFSVHARYVIPALPFLFVWTSKVGRVFELRPFTPRRKLLAAAVSGAILWSVLSSLAIYPHSLSYFNELAALLPTPADASYPKPMEQNASHGVWAKVKAAFTAGPRHGPRHLLGSNIDWGQDLFLLKKWLDKHPHARLDGLACWGSYPAALAGIPETPMPPTNLDDGPKAGWYALSVNYLYDRTGQYRYFLHFRPAAMAGYSIYIYHLTPEEVNRVRRQLRLPILQPDQDGIIGVR